MLVIPSRGFARSVATSNIKTEILCDWIEASLLFVEAELSVTDVANALIDAGICDEPDTGRQYADYEETDDSYMDQEQDLARQIVIDAWFELSRRAKWIGEGCAYSINSNWLRRKGSWTEYPAQAFFVLLSLATAYDWWVKEHGSNYTEQGELFELITLEALQTQLSGWKVYQTGWTRNNTLRLNQVVQSICELLLADVDNQAIELWDNVYSKELGLDLLLYRPFSDGRLGIPVYLVQCASGNNWKTKRHDPDLNIWEDLIKFHAKPQRGFAIPFALRDTEFQQSAAIVTGFLVDRCRLLMAGQYNSNWLSNSLHTRTVNWLNPKIDTLLSRSQ